MFELVWMELYLRVCYVRWRVWRVWVRSAEFHRGSKLNFCRYSEKSSFYYINNPIVRESAPCAQEKHLNDLLRTLVTLFLLITWTNLQPHLPQNWERTIASILRTCSHNPAFATIQ